MPIKLSDIRNDIPAAFTDYGELMYMVLLRKKLAPGYVSVSSFLDIGSSTVEKYYKKGSKALLMAIAVGTKSADVDTVAADATAFLVQKPLDNEEQREN